MKTLIALLFIAALPLMGQKSISDYKGNFRLYVYSKKEPIMEKVEYFYNNVQKIVNPSELQAYDYNKKNIDYYAKSLYSVDTLIVDSVNCDCFPMKKYGTSVSDRLWVRTYVQKKSFYCCYVYSQKPEITFDISFETDKKGKTLVEYSFTGKNKHIKSYQENLIEYSEGEVKCRIYELEIGLMNFLKSKFKTSPYIE